VSRVVLDASAVLAVLRREPAHERVLPELDRGVISAVNLAEVVAVLARFSGDPEAVLADLLHLVRDVRPFDAKQAIETGRMELRTRPFGLSLADRACLALARSLDLPVLTADRAWSGIDVGVAVELIRPEESRS
jgi:ribonuclease VapC